MTGTILRRATVIIYAGCAALFAGAALVHSWVLFFPAVACLVISVFLAEHLREGPS